MPHNNKAEKRIQYVEVKLNKKALQK